MHPTGDSLQNLQEHTAVVYQDKVYVFGGEVGFSSASESPLWSYSIKVMYIIWNEKPLKDEVGICKICTHMIYRHIL